MRNIVRWLLICSLCVMFCELVPVDKAAASQLIRIGYTNNYPSVFENLPHEKLKGFGVDYLREVSSRTYWKYKYTECQSTAEALKLMDNGDVDMIVVGDGELTDSERRQLTLSDVMAHGYIYLYTQKEKSDWYFNDFTKLDGAVIGYFSDNADKDRLNNYLRLHNINADLREYPDQSALEAALQSGEIAALFLQDIQPDLKLREIGYANGDKLRLAAVTSNSQLISRVDDAVDELEQINPGLVSQLIEQARSDCMEDACALFTKEEIEYIKEHPVIVTASFSNHPPFSWYDRQSGQMKGIYEEILNEISRISGIEFVVQSVPDTIRPYELLKTGQFDLFAGVVRTNNFVESDEINVSDSFLFSDMGIVARKGFVPDWQGNVKIAVPQHFQALQEFLEYQDYEYVWVNDNEDAFRAVADGRADILMLNEYSIDYWLQRPEYDGLHVIPTTVPTFRERSAFATRGTMDPRLISILNKSLAAMGRDKISRNIVVKATANPYQPTWPEILYRHRATVIVIIISSVMLLVVAVRFYKRH